MLRKTKTLIAVLSIGFVASVVVSGADVFQIPSAHAATDDFFDGVNRLQTNWSLFIELAVAVSFIMYPIVSALLDPKVFLDISGGGQSDLLLIWQLSRDIMNTIFAFMLVAGAMMTVVMAKPEIMRKYAIKFVLGVILVNFSWFFPRVILDISHVLTANIYQLPSIVGTQCRFRDNSGALVQCRRPTDFNYFPNADEIRDFEAAGYECPGEIICYKPVDLDNNTNIADGIMAGLMMNHARLPEMNRVVRSIPTPTGDNILDKIRQVVVAVVRAGLQLLMVVYIAIIIVGMAVALLVRIPILWMTMAFMPLMFLGFVIGDLMDSKFNTMNLIFKKFLHAAFLPAAMAIPLSVGFILMNALAFGPPPDSTGELGRAVGKVLPGVPDLWSLLWQLIAIVIMWKGFRMALSIDTVFETATSGITQFGQNIGTIARNAPLNIPILPTGKKGSDGKPELATLGQASSGLGGLAGLSRQGNLANKLERAKSEDSGGAGGGAGGRTDININVRGTPAADAIKTALDNASSSSTPNRLSDVDIRNMASAIKRAFPTAETPQQIQAIKDELKRLSDNSFIVDEEQSRALEEAVKNA